MMEQLDLKNLLDANTTTGEQIEARPAKVNEKPSWVVSSISI
jgi:hypothetical protein